MTTIPPGDIAPIQRRVIAYVIDALIAGVLPVVATVVIASLMVGALQSPESAAGALASVAVAAGVSGLLILGWFVVYTIMQTGKGSIGMRAQRIRLVGAVDLAPLSFWRALLRNVVFAVTGSFVVGLFSPLFDGTGRYQGWHDKVAGAIMLDAAAVPAAASAAAPAAPSVTPPAPPALPNPLATGGYTGQPTPPAPPAPFAFPQPTRDAPPLPDGFPDETIVAPRHASPAAPVLPAAPAYPAAPVPDASAAASDETIAAPPARQELPGDPLISFVPGVTQPGAAPAPPAPAPAAPAPAPAAPAPVVPAPEIAAPASPAEQAPAAQHGSAQASAHDVDDDLEATRISVPGHRLVFTWDDGQRVSVSTRTVFGRNPEQEPGTVVVSVRDETLSLSKTHFEAGSEPTGGWVMDRHSTNGLTIVRDGTRIACPPGQRVPVRLGDALEIGDRIVTIGGFA
ncbi:RDD family protein [Microbacterium esteraromaticum]|uniref:RDD family protein n=1 Tax=Microbacterium esteraromaticum TaxID=57043 RepID=UPI00195EAD1B|nr:RDD family protein [Microbacterium esteraromaticum]MBM7466461.1 putative RDD family membrane protein YckC [Microbacterium esteraromaticum]